MYLILILASFVSMTHQNVVTTAQGLIRGVSKEGYISYIGIPYASANGTGRFKVSILSNNLVSESVFNFSVDTKTANAKAVRCISWIHG